MVHVVVVGPGALGTLFAVRLAQAGHEVTLACRTAKTAKQVQVQGAILRDDRGEHRVSVRAVHKPKQLHRPADTLVIATKCSAAVDAASMWRPDASHIPAVCLQNGLMAGDLQHVAGPGFVPCTVGFPATWDGAGRSIQTGPGALHMGTWPTGPASGIVERAADLLAAVEPVLISDNMRGIAWTKLLVNSVGMVGVLTGRPLGELLRHPRAKDAFLAIVEEGHLAGLADGVRFEKVAGFHPRRLAQVGRIGGRVGQHVVLGLVARKYRRMRSSSLQSLERGQQTEAMYLNGAIQAAARVHGIASPVNDALLAGIQDIESGQGPPSLARLDALPL